CFFFPSGGGHTRWPRDWSSDVCSSDLTVICVGSAVLAPRLARETRGEHGRTHTDDGGKLADHAFEPESARNANRSLSGAASTSISSPRANSPTRIFSESGSSTYF